MATYKRWGKLDPYTIENASVDRLGVTTAEVHCTMDGNQIDYGFLNLNSSPQGAVSLPCVGVRVAKGKGSHTFIYTHDGKLDPQDGKEAYCELEGTDSDKAIETHPKFLDLVSKYGGSYNADGSFAGFPKTMPGDAKTKNPLYGTDSYISIGWVWTLNYTAPELPESVYKSAGCIDQPQGLDGQMPPELDGVRNWLRLAPRCTWRGNVWTIAERWQASGREGANKDVYQAIN